MAETSLEGVAKTHLDGAMAVSSSLDLEIPDGRIGGIASLGLKG